VRASLFRTHEDTGRKAVYINRLMTVGVVECRRGGEPLLNAVFDHAEKREFGYDTNGASAICLLWTIVLVACATGFPRPSGGLCCARRQGSGAAIIRP